MKSLLPLILCVLGATAWAQTDQAKVTRDMVYADTDPLQKLDIYAAPGAKGQPVVVWIHGGGWQQGDKAEMRQKPQLFTDRGLVFVSVNYRLWPKVVMGDIIRDVAKSIHWVHDHIAQYGGDPERVLVMGHSAGAQLAAIVCTDERYIQDEGIKFSILKGCVPVDGDTYDVPAIVATAQTRRRVHHQPEPKAGHPEKFGTVEQQQDYSAVNHIAAGKGIPPFLILHVADHPDTSAQAFRLGSVLKEAGLPVTTFAARDTNHGKLNDNLGVPGDPATKALTNFVDGVLKR